LQHSLKKRLLLKENAAHRLQSALKTRYSLRKELIFLQYFFKCGKINYVSLMELSLPRIFLYDHCLRKNLTSSKYSNCLEDKVSD
jgi:hypothetical protein